MLELAVDIDNPAHHDLSHRVSDLAMLAKQIVLRLQHLLPLHQLLLAFLRILTDLLGIVNSNLVSGQHSGVWFVKQVVLLLFVLLQPSLGLTFNISIELFLNFIILRVQGLFFVLHGLGVVHAPHVFLLRVLSSVLPHCWLSLYIRDVLPKNSFLELSERTS